MGFGKKYKDNLDAHGSTSVYVPLEINKPVKLLIVGEEVTGPADFIENKGYVRSSYEQGGRLRFAVHAYCDKQMRILDGPETLYKELGKLSEMIDIESNVIAIEKESNKKYNVRGLQALTPAQVDKVKAMQRPDLNQIGWLKGTVPAPAPQIRKAAPKIEPDVDPFLDEVPPVDDGMAANSEPTDDESLPF